jgi:hypothetical protein
MPRPKRPGWAKGMVKLAPCVYWSERGCIHVGDTLQMCEEFGIRPTDENVRRMCTVSRELVQYALKGERPTATVEYAVRICEEQRRLIRESFSEPIAARVL